MGWELDQAMRLLGAFLAIIAAGAFVGGCGAAAIWLAHRRIERREKR